MLQIGGRNATIDRDFTNYANANSTTSTGRSDADYQIKRSYSKFLPNLGVKFNLDTQQSMFFNVAENFKAPGNFSFQNLLQGGTVTNGVLTGATLRNPAVGMETSTNMDLGYRMQTESTTLSGSVFMVNYKNRIASAYDPATALSVDYNVGNVSVKGLELEAGQKLNKNFSFYSSLSYTESQMKQDLKTSVTVTEATAGKTMPDTPKWMAAVGLSYKQGPWFGQLTAKHTGKAFTTLVNDEEMKAYTLLNLAAGYKFASSGFFKAPEVRLNIDNLADTKYQRISSNSGSQFTTRALGSGGRGASFYIGAPRFASVTLRSDF